METIQPPPPPQRTGNPQIDVYLRRIYEWAYLLWHYQTGAGIQDPAITASTGAASSAGIIIPGLDGEQGEEGPMGFPGATGPRGLPGLTIPGMDGQDGDDWQIPLPVKAPDSYRLEGATWDAPGAIGATTAAPGTFTTFGCNGAAAQTAYASGGALNAYGAGANGLDSGANMSALHAMVVSIRAALVANGTMS